MLKHLPSSHLHLSFCPSCGWCVGRTRDLAAPIACQSCGDLTPIISSPKHFSCSFPLSIASTLLRLFNHEV